ncbi:FAD-dependent oxidoreductase [Microbacterium trichothecenolyticum]|uniref:2-polyprenyl-6-methoxyphenol hydroxylase-like FAD-dependent oxidoreductase n=1 Tax=Microbacterium trichothecenolyticum TaxID=69370 RepID=A0ABU0TYR6_MICTR|nr:NAD(P)/FAD-dependent oxidoreductase [Microbacterium trichothecenolyticum]MDQ1124801.1 2-polyprenyl-6-methoxyphenol hydroxylase-like FAD-dependent oxidoreductase [Microbacterium trichothecenolyticum]
MPDVLIVGAGPVGLALAADLRARGLDVGIVDKRPAAASGTRAIGIHSPALALLEGSGAADALLARAVRIGRGEARADGRLLAAIRFDRLRVRHPYVAALPQADTVDVLTALAPPVRHGVEVTAVHAGRHDVRIVARGPGGREEIRAALVVVASGWAGRELVYRPGVVRTHHYPDRYVMADVETPGDAVARVHLEREGVLESFPLPGGRRRLVAWAGTTQITDAADTLRRALIARIGVHVDTSTASSFRVRRAVAPALRRGRIVVVGDAAHEVSPIGGQGMNLGLLDALTLAPLLPGWLRSGETDGLGRWEADRLASARHAARLARVNTMLGRAAAPAAHIARTAALRTALRGPGGALFTRAYAMRFDRGALE